MQIITTRSNYFRTTDADKLRRLIFRTVTDDQPLNLWELQRPEGVTLYAFGGYGGILGVGGEPDLPAFQAELSELVAPDDAVIITEVSSEDFYCLDAWATVITRKGGRKTLSLQSSSVLAARDLLGNESFITRMSY